MNQKYLKVINCILIKKINLIINARGYTRKIMLSDFNKINTKAFFCHQGLFNLVI